MHKADFCRSVSGFQHCLELTATNSFDQWVSYILNPDLKLFFLFSRAFTEH